MRSLAALLGLALVLLPTAVRAEGEAEGESATDKLKELLGGGEAEMLPAPWEEPREGEDACTPEEMAVLRELRARSRELDGRAYQLDEREREIEELEAHAAEQIARLDAMRTELLAVISGEEERQNDKVAQLSKVVAQMKAKKAAPMLAGMDQRTALAVLERVPAKQAGKILAAMPAETAQRLGDAYTKLRDPRVEESATEAGAADGTAEEAS